MVLVLHRRAGKTTAVLNHLQRDALRVPKSDYAYIAPTYKMAKRIAWKLLEQYSRVIDGVIYNKSDLMVTYPNGSTLTLYGSESVDSLRGIGLWGCGLDENSQQPSNIFSEIISKCLADHLGYCIWLGTPKGKNQFHKTYRTAKKNRDRYLAIYRTIDSTLANEEGETIENLRLSLEEDRKLVEDGEMTEEEFQQEWYCSFEAAIKGAYYLKQISTAKKDKRIKTVPYDENLDVHTVWDLGVGQALGIGFYQRLGNEVKMIDYWQGSNYQGIKDGCKACKDKPYLYGKHFAPHDVRSKEESTGETRIAFAKKHGIDFIVVPSISVDDGIDKGKLFWSRLWVDKKKCEYWLDAIAQYHQEWDDKKGMFRDHPYHDWTSHPADVHRYAAIVEKQMTNDSERVVYKQEKVKSTSRYAGTKARTPQPHRRPRPGRGLYAQR